MFRAHDQRLTELDEDIRQPVRSLAGRHTGADKVVMDTRDVDRPNGDDLSVAYRPSAGSAYGSCREWAV